MEKSMVNTLNFITLLKVFLQNFRKKWRGGRETDFTTLLKAKIFQKTDGGGCPETFFSAGKALQIKRSRSGDHYSCCPF